MKEISRRSIKKTVKEEYKEAREWCSMDHFRYYVMMIDTSDGEIWSDVLLNENEWKRYRSSTITSLDYTPGYIYDTEAGYIDDAIRKLKEAGWTITD